MIIHCDRCDKLALDYYHTYHLSGVYTKMGWHLKHYPKYDIFSPNLIKAGKYIPYGCEELKLPDEVICPACFKNIKSHDLTYSPNLK